MIDTRTGRRLSRTLLNAVLLVVVACLGVSVGAAGATSGDSPPPTRPNIVVIMVDDLAEMDLRVWNRLPNIKQQFITHGTRFTDYYGNDPLCCPGRSNFITGLFTDHHGVWMNDARLLDPSVTLATRLQGVGYHTIISGKYLNLTERLADKTPAGWDDAAIFSGAYYAYRAWVNGSERRHGTAPEDYSTRVFADLAAKFITRAPANKPIFAFLTPYAVHDGRDANGATNYFQPVVEPRYKKDPRCAGIKAWSPPNYDEVAVSDKPIYVRAREPLAKSLGAGYAHGWPLATVCRSLLSVDDELGQVRDALRARGRLSNTLFILTGDNGMAFGAHRWPKKSVPYAAQLPLFVSWGHEPGTNTTTLENVDWAPTLCELAGCEMGPYPNGQASSDGQSFLGLIASDRSSSAPVRKAIYIEHREDRALRPAWREILTTSADPLGTWIYVSYQNGEAELYRRSMQACSTWTPANDGDPCLLRNLANLREYSTIQAILARRLAAMVVDPLPTVP